MKKFIGGLMLVGGFAFASAQTITFDKTTVDYGTIALNSDGHRFFTIKNTGDKPLILSKVQPGCGCTTPEWSTDPIMPGKSAKIKVGYNTANPGNFHKQIEVYSNDPVNGRVVLFIQGNVDSNAKVEEVKAVPATPAEPKVAPAVPAQPAKGKVVRTMRHKKVKA